MGLLSALKDHFLQASTDVLIPSPLEVCVQTFHLAMEFKDACIAHTKEVRRQQEEFQQRLQAIGIERLSRLTHREVLEMYGC